MEDERVLTGPEDLIPDNIDELEEFFSEDDEYIVKFFEDLESSSKGIT